MRSLDLAVLEDRPVGDAMPGIRGYAGRAPVFTPALLTVLKDATRELVCDGALACADALEGKTVIRNAGERIGISLNNYEVDQILAEVEKQRRPFGPLQELVDDTSISDIVISAYDKVAVRQGCKNYRTDVTFPDNRSYLAFVEGILSQAGTSCSTKRPVADGMIGSLARIHAIHSSICESGPYLTIRLNRFPSVAIGDLVASRMGPAEIFEYLSGVIKAERTILIAGEVGTGKTTLARALGAQIDPAHSIIVIEDTPEIRLEHPHVRYIRSRSENSEGAGRVSPAECIRAAMRMAMNRIIFGEIRDSEAAESFLDCCSSGHAGLSTIHAGSANDALGRMELFLARAKLGSSRAVHMEQIAAAVQVVVFLEVCRTSGRRRIAQVKEVGPFVDGVLRQREMFTYQHNGSRACWKTAGRFSAFKEALESQTPAIALTEYPAVITE